MNILKTRWMRWAMAGVGVLLAYSAIGFGLLPYLVQLQAPKLGQSELERRVSVEGVQFNPFTLRLQVQGFRLAEANDAPLLSLDALGGRPYVGLIDSARVDLYGGADRRPHSAISPLHRTEHSMLPNCWPPSSANSPVTSQKVTCPAWWWIDSFWRQGKVDVSDQQAGYVNTISPINFELSSFSTLPDQTGNYRLNAASLLGGKLSWTGQVSLSPMQARGELTLEDAALVELAAYLQPYTVANLKSGRLSATLPYRVAYHGGRLEANLTGASVHLRDLILAAGEGRESLANLKQVNLDQLNADLMARAISVGSLQIKGGTLALTRQQDGKLDWAQLGVPARETQSVPVEVGAPMTWALEVHQVALDQVAFHATDHTVSPPLNVDVGKAHLNLNLTAEQTDKALTLAVKDAGLTLDNLSLASGTQNPLTVDQLGFSDGSMNLAEREVTLGQLLRRVGNCSCSATRPANSR